MDRTDETAAELATAAATLATLVKRRHEAWPGRPDLLPGLDFAIANAEDVLDELRAKLRAESLKK